MDAIIAQLQDIVDGPIDFEGQRLAEGISTVVLTVTAIIAFAVGFIRQDIYLTLWIGLAGTIMVMLMVVPAWPWLNQNPQPWIGSRTTVPIGGIVVGGGKT